MTSRSATRPDEARAVGARPPRYLNCPRCGLTIRPRADWLAIEHCPRCLARRRVPVALFTSALPAERLYAAKGRPDGGDADRPPGGATG